MLNLLIVANQAINLVLGQARKLIESARPVSKALPLMPINDTVYFRQISHIRRPQAASSQSAKKIRRPGTTEMSKKLAAFAVLHAVRRVPPLRLLGTQSLDRDGSAAKAADDMRFVVSPGTAQEATSIALAPLNAMLLRVGFCAILGYTLPGEVAEHVNSVRQEIPAFRSAREIIGDRRYAMTSEAKEFDYVCNRACHRLLKNTRMRLKTASGIKRLDADEPGEAVWRGEQPCSMF